MNKIFLSTGGTGGHINPAISLAESLNKVGYKAIIIGDDYCTEKYFENKNIKHHNIKAGKQLISLKGFFDILTGFFQSLFLILKYRPSLIIGFGSYATFPMLAAGVVSFRKIILHEQNAYMGKVNKIFGRFSKSIMTAYSEIYGIRYDDCKKVVMTGNPVRKEIQDLYKNKYEAPAKDGKINLFIVGGSGGAKFLSNNLTKSLDKLPKEDKERLNITQQCREEDIENVKSFYKKEKINATLDTFFTNVPEILSKTHIVISRAGASATAEFAMAGIPMILIPFTSSQNNRQIVNAEFFAKNSSAIVIKESDFDANNFCKTFSELINNSKKLEEMSKKAKENAVLNVEDNIISVIKEVLND